MRDVAVIGSGPAGLAVGAHAAALGLDVVVVAPDPQAEWPNTYGIWADELIELGLQAALQRLWPKARVRLDAQRTHVFPRAYGLVDNLALRRALEGIGGSGLALESGRVMSIEHAESSSLVHLEDGRTVAARAVVDASGASSGLVARPDPGPVAAQVAYGVLAEVAAHDLPLDEMLLMDFGGPGEGPPTFLYAMPLGPRRIFIEETVLVARPVPQMSVLQDGLQRRIAQLGLRIEQILEEERCVIPMGGPIPRGPQRVVPFGAAASMVHPATGYLLNRILALAPALAAGLAHGLERCPDDPRVAASQGWEAVWPRARRERWEVFRFGMEVLVELDLDGTRDFFDAFFRTRPERWSAFLSGRATGGQMARCMAEVFARAPNTVRRRLLAHAVGRPGLDLLARLAI